MLYTMFHKKITTEMDDFECNMLKQSAETVYNSYYKIYFYKSVGEYLLNCLSDLNCIIRLLTVDFVLEDIYNYWLNLTYYCVDSFGSCFDLLHGYMHELIRREEGV